MKTGVELGPCDTCFESYDDLKRHPGSSWMVECRLCRKYREDNEHEVGRLERVEAKLDGVLQKLQKLEDIALGKITRSGR